jgi:hypothetical protein
LILPMSERRGKDLLFNNKNINIPATKNRYRVIVTASIFSKLSIKKTGNIPHKTAVVNEKKKHTSVFLLLYLLAS